MPCWQQHPARLTGDGDILFFGRQHLTGGITSFVLEVDQKPEFVAVDPFLNLMDRNRFDNVLNIGIKAKPKPNLPVR